MNKKSKDLKKIIFVETFTKSANNEIKYVLLNTMIQIQ